MQRLQLSWKRVWNLTEWTETFLNNFAPFEIICWIGEVVCFQIPFLLVSALLPGNILYLSQRPLAGYLKFKAMRWYLQVVKRCIKKRPKLNQLRPTSRYALNGELKKKTLPQVYIKDFPHRYKNRFLKSEFFHRYFSRILLKNSDTFLDFFEGMFQEICC